MAKVNRLFMDHPKEKVVYLQRNLQQNHLTSNRGQEVGRNMTITQRKRNNSTLTLWIF
jgi:hypothetical protein